MKNLLKRMICMALISLLLFSVPIDSHAAQTWKTEGKNQQMEPLSTLYLSNKIKIKSSRVTKNKIVIRWKKRRDVNGYYLAVASNRQFKNRMYIYLRQNTNKIVIRPGQQGMKKNKFRKIKYIMVCGWKYYFGGIIYTRPTIGQLKTR